MLPIADIAQRIGICGRNRTVRTVQSETHRRNASCFTKTRSGRKRAPHPRYHRNADEYGGGKVDRFDRACRCTQ